MGTRTVHPAESFAGDHFEVDALITVLGVDEMREPDSIELLRNDAVEVDECRCHPVKVLLISITAFQVDCVDWAYM
jgi:hypothetical protein